MAGLRSVPNWLSDGNGATEGQEARPLAGSPDRPGREPVRKPKPGERGSMGDTAVVDALIIVIVAWVVLFFLAYSLRHHNI